jgi:hypothetical protein
LLQETVASFEVRCCASQRLHQVRRGVHSSEQAAAAARVIQMNQGSAGACGCSSHSDAAADASTVALDGQFVDHYLRRMMPIVRFVDHRRVLVNLEQLLNPRELVHAAMFFHAQRRRRPPPRLPRYMQFQLQPLQLQRFLRGCVFATAHALATPPASVIRLVHARTKSRCFDCIFVRVMSSFVARAEVRRQRARCACACRAALVRLYFTSARMVYPSFH